MLRVCPIRCHVFSGTGSTLLRPLRCYVRYSYRCRLFPYYLGGGQLECASVRILCSVFIGRPLHVSEVLSITDHKTVLVFTCMLRIV